MRLCIDATPLLLRSAGIKTYLYYWTLAVRAAAAGRRVSVFPFLDDLGACDHERSPYAWLPTMARIALLQSANYGSGAILNWIGWKHDLLHVSNQLRKPPGNIRLTTTIHDMTCWLMPELHSEANVRATMAFTDRVVRRAARLIAVSEATRQDAIRILNLKPEMIEVIHHGIAPEYFDAKPHAAAKPYVLFVGTIEPRKNIGTLLDAWQSLPQSVRDEFELVLAGPAGWKQEELLARLKSGIPGVRYQGYVPESELPALMAGATVFVYPSLYEGFGFPVVQAMAARVPVVTSNVSSLPEVAGPGALLADPRSPAELCAALQRLLLSPALRQEIGAEGAAHAQQYRWEVCARKSWEFFERAAERD